MTEARDAGTSRSEDVRFDDDGARVAGMSVSEVREWLRAWVSNATGQPASAISDERPMEEFGLSSRDAVTLSGDIEDRLGVVLTATVAYQHPTIAALATRIVEGEPETDTDAVADGDYLRPDRTAADDIAIVGLSTRFPGAGRTPESTWEFLLTGGDGVRELPDDRWTEFRCDPALAATIAAANTAGGYLDDVTGFDADFFQMSPREVEMVDPQQRLALELTWEALENSRIPASELKGGNVGVFIGSSTNDYQLLAVSDPESNGDTSAYALTGTQSAVIAGRVSYYFDFHGPAVTLDTACSSSLVAVHQAVRSLRSGESDVAIAGGVNMILAPAATLGFDKIGAQAANKRIRAFSDDADGMIRGEGGGLFVLKRVADARRDGDPILAVVAGSAVNSDGRSNGLPAPNPEAQAAVLRAAYRDAGIVPRDVDYVEAHGTGTILGDPIEAGALGRVVGRGRDAHLPLLLGSAKTNFGHLESGAGAAALAKTVLAIGAGVIPRNLHFNKPNPYIQFEQDHITVVAENTEWPRYSGHAVAGVSGFGFSGTNAHIVVREPLPSDLVDPETPADEPAADFAPCAVPGALTPLVVSGFLPSRRRAAAADLADWLETPAGQAASLTAVGRTLARRNHGRSRAVVMARGHADAVKGLRAVAEGKASPLVFSADAPDSASAVWVLSGFGSQHRKMAKQLYQENPVFATALDEVDALIENETGYSIVAQFLDDEVTYGVETSQIGIFAIQVGLIGLLRHHGAEPGVVVPHSMGEATGAYLTGGLSLADAVRVICARSRLMGEGEAMLTGDLVRYMALVEYSAGEIGAVVAEYPDLEICVYAAPTHTVVGGPAEQIDAIVARCEGEGKLARKLQTKGASHTSQTDPLLGELAYELAGIEARPIETGLYSSVHREAFFRPGSAPVHDIEYWTKGLRHSVWFVQAVTRAVEDGHRTFVELSPNPVVLLSIAATTYGAGITDAELVETLRRKADENDGVVTALAKLYVHGHAVDVASLYGSGEYADLPRTRWNRKRLWLTARIGSAGVLRAPGAHVALPDGRHAWQAVPTAVGAPAELALAAARQVLTAPVLTASSVLGELGAAESVTTTLTPHLGGASIVVDAREQGGFRRIFEAVVADDAASAPVAAAVVAAPVEYGDQRVEDLGEVVEDAGARWDPASGESVEDRLATIVAESMGYEPEDLPREIPLIDLGLDSLMGMRIKNRVEYEFDIPQLQLQAMRDANLHDVARFVTYAVDNREAVAALAEHQGAGGELPSPEEIEAYLAEKERASAEGASEAEPEPVAEPAAVAEEPAAELAVAEPEPAAVAEPESPVVPEPESAAVTEPAAAPTPAAAPVDTFDQAAVATAAGVDVPPRDAAERLTFATYAIVTKTSAKGIFNPLPVLPESVAQALADRLSERLGAEIDVEDVIDSDTIETMAGYVREKLEGDGIDGFVRTLREPTPGSARTPVLLFHPAGGSTMAYDALVRTLPTDVPIYGFERVEGSIEERVRQYVPKILELQPEGPYVLVGWSLGGALAYGAAHQLRELGHEVAFVGLIDAVMPADDSEETREQKRARLERYLTFAKGNYNLDDDIPIPMDRLVEADDEGQITLLIEMLAMSSVKIPGGIIEHQRTSFIDNRVLATAKPQRYDGKVVLYRAEKMHADAVVLEPRWGDVEPDGSWGRYVDDLEVIHIGGDHIAIVDEPYIGRIGADLSRRLGRLGD